MPIIPSVWALEGTSRAPRTPLSPRVGQPERIWEFGPNVCSDCLHHPQPPFQLNGTQSDQVGWGVLLANPRGNGRRSFPSAVSPSRPLCPIVHTTPHPGLSCLPLS